MTKPKVAIIVLNYNGYELTKECLVALSRITYSENEIFLIDNGSTRSNEQKNLSKLAQYFDHFISIPGKNRGFAGGMNFGMETAEKCGGFEYFVCYSNDVIPKPDFLDRLIETMQADPQIGIAGPVQYYYNSKLEKRSIYCAGTFVSKYRVRCGHIHKIRQSPPLDYVNGAIFCIRRACFHQTGGFDPLYYNWYEDIDLSARAHRLGWKLSIVPDSSVWHKVAQTVKKPDFRFTLHSVYYHYRNKVLFVKKNRQGKTKLIFMIYFFLILLPSKALKTFFQILKNPASRKTNLLILKTQYRGAYEGLFGRRFGHTLETIPRTD